MIEVPASSHVTLGILAGGRASRLGGIDKSWLLREGLPQVMRWQRLFAGEVAAILVSANRDLGRYRDAGLQAVADRGEPDLGPMGGLDALAATCATPWLLTIPVDLVNADSHLISMLASGRARDGAYAIDDEGVQPLVALWRTEALRVAVSAALQAGDQAVHGLHRKLAMASVRIPGPPLGNLNTPADLGAAGVSIE